MTKQRRPTSEYDQERLRIKNEEVIPRQKEHTCQATSLFSSSHVENIVFKIC